MNKKIYTDIKTVPVWNKESTVLEVYSLKDKQKNIIPVIKIESWEDYFELIKDDMFEGSNLIYRGHSSSDWLLTSSLSRINSNCLLEQAVVDEQLNNFKNHMAQDNLNFNDRQLWTIGQHHGLLTPFLDWTINHIVALYFAFFEDIKTDYRSIFILDKNKCTNNNIEFVEYKDIAPNGHPLFGRFVCQEGCFTQTKDHASIENKDNSGLLCKIYIKNIGQWKCLKYLQNLDISSRHLFPDIHGIALTCNQEIYKRKKSVFGGIILKFEQTVVDSEQVDAISKMLSETNDNNDHTGYDEMAKNLYTDNCPNFFV